MEIPWVYIDFPVKKGLPVEIVDALYIENTRWVSFDVKFIRQGFENTC